MSLPSLRFACVCGATSTLPPRRPVGAVTCSRCGLTPLAPANLEAPRWRERWTRGELLPRPVLERHVLL